MTFMAWNTLFGQFGSIILSVFLPASCICKLARLGKQDGVLGLIHNNWYHQGVYQHSSHTKSKTHQLLRGKINSIPAKTRTPAQVFPASPSCSPSFFAGLCPAPSPSFCCLSSSLHCFFAHLCQAPCPSLSPSFSRYPVSCLVLSRYAPLSCKLPLFSSLVVFRALLFVFSSLQV